MNHTILLRIYNKRQIYSSGNVVFFHFNIALLILYYIEFYAMNHLRKILKTYPELPVPLFLFIINIFMFKEISHVFFFFVLAYNIVIKFNRIFKKSFDYVLNKNYRIVFIIIRFCHIHMLTITFDMFQGYLFWMEELYFSSYHL